MRSCALRSSCGAAAAACAVAMGVQSPWGTGSGAAADAPVPTLPAALQNAGAWHELDESTAKLRLVQVVFRHGARTPLSKSAHLWAHDPEWSMCSQVPPYSSPTKLELVSTSGEKEPISEDNLKQMARKMPGGCFAGELTQLGHTQAYGLGEALRRRYVSDMTFLPPDLCVDALSARTTNYDRTIKTLQGVVSGLYPESETPLPVVTSSHLDEILFADSRGCPHLGAFLQLSKQIAKSSLLKDPEYGWVKEELQRVLGVDMDKAWSVTDVHDAMTSMRAHGKAMPEGMSDRLLAAINRLATREFAAFVAPSIADEHGRNVLRLSMGVLLHSLVTNMESVVAGNAGPQLYLYSGHDSTVMPLLLALGLDLAFWPPYVSNLIFELWELPSGEHIVRVMYNLHDLHLSAAPPGRLPTLEQFSTQVLGPFVLSESDRGAACQVQVTHDSSMPKPIVLSSVMDDDA